MDGQLEALVALDDWYIALQRIRDVVAAAETYLPSAFRESVRPLWQDAREAQTKLLSALGTLERETAKERKPVEIQDDEGHIIGWQETLINSKRAARVSVVGETVKLALEDTESGHAQREVQLCLSCENIGEKCPRCGADARPSPAHVGSDTWTEFHCSSCNFRFPDNGKNGLCPKCLNPTRRKRVG
jgi:hypothetical protein